MKHFIVSLLVGFWLLGPHAFGAVNARNGVSITTASTINGRTPNSAINGQTITGGGSPAYFYSEGADVSGAGTETDTTNGQAILSRVVLASGGTVTKLGLYARFVNFSTGLKLALFDSSRNYISGATTTNTVTSGDAQWHDFAISTAVSSGTYYIGFSTNNDNGIKVNYNTEASGDVYETFDTYANFPASITGLSSSNTPRVVRLELTP